jgi:hypothetical protein
MCKHLEDGSYYRVNVKIVTFTLFYCYLKKNCFQTYFNQVSLDACIHALILWLRPEEKRKKGVGGGAGGPQPASGILKFGYLKIITLSCFMLL